VNCMRWDGSTGREVLADVRPPAPPHIERGASQLEAVMRRFQQGSGDICTEGKRGVFFHQSGFAYSPRIKCTL